MGKHDAHSHTVSPSGKLVFCFQRVYCGNQDYLIVSTVEDRKVIYAEIHTNGYTFWPYGKVYWETDQNGEDILVDDRVYLFFERNGQLVLMEGDEQTVSEEQIFDNCFKDKTSPGFDSIVMNAHEFSKNDVHIEHRLVKYKRDPTKQTPKTYETDIQFNCEMVVTEDSQGDLFKRWRQQDTCQIYLMESPYFYEQHPKREAFLNAEKDKTELPRPHLAWFIKIEPWDEYNWEYL